MLGGPGWGLPEAGAKAVDWPMLDGRLLGV